MLCRIIKNKRYWYLLILVGAVSLAFGLIGVLTEPQASGNIAMLLGMFTGLGGTLFVFSIIRLLYLRFAPAAKLKQEEINRNDERNIQVARAASAAANTAVTIMLTIMAFAFVLMGYKVPGYIAVGAIWVQAIVTVIAQRICEKKM